jgi:hypothetical protein
MIFFEDAYNKAKEHEDEYFIFLQEYFNDPTLKKTTKKFQALIDDQSLLFLLKPVSSIGLHISSVPFFILYQSWKCFPNSTY